MGHVIHERVRDVASTGDLTLSHWTLSRRAMLAGTVVVAGTALAACSSDEPAPDATADADAALRQSVAEDEQRLIALYDATIAVVDEGPLRTTLQTLRDQHAEHAATIAPEVGPAQVAGGVPTIADLQALERAAASARRDACVAATDAELARVLTFIGAAEAAHVPALTQAVLA